MSHRRMHVALFALTLAGANLGAQELDGRWIIDPPRRVTARDSVQLRLEQDTPRGGYSNWGRLLPFSAFQGLALEQIAGATADSEATAHSSPGPGTTPWP